MAKGTYDLEANLALLRFYQYNPATAKIPIVCKVSRAVGGLACLVLGWAQDGGVFSMSKASQKHCKRETLNLPIKIDDINVIRYALRCALSWGTDTLAWLYRC